MMKKVRIGLLAAFLLMTAFAIIATNLKYNKYLKPTRMTMGDEFKGSGYNLTVCDCKVFAFEELEQYIDDLDQFEQYKKMFEFDGYVVLVNATLKITDKDSIRKDWWTDFILYSDNAWHNPVDIYLTSLIKDANPTKGNYVNGEEYELIFPVPISEKQVPKHELDNAKNWNYFFVYSQNPIVYIDINKG